MLRYGKWLLLFWAVAYCFLPNPFGLQEKQWVPAVISLALSQACDFLECEFRGRKKQQTAEPDEETIERRRRFWMAGGI